MLNRLPTFLPPLSAMLADIGNPTPKRLAKALGVSPRTVARWLSADDAPRTALLSIFWLTRWGMSLADCELHNLAALNADLAGALQHRIKALQAQMERLGRIGDFGSANDPMPGVPIRARLPIDPLNPGATEKTNQSNPSVQPLNRRTYV